MTDKEVETMVHRSVKCIDTEFKGVDFFFRLGVWNKTFQDVRSEIFIFTNFFFSKDEFLTMV